jgi:15,16-dihydrobiliverdin:ferredoxin oxidoreductase
MGGEALQVFNCVIYPNHQYDLPFLGIDLLSFSNVKNLVVLDFQPLYQDDAYQAKYIAPLQSLHEKYRDLVQGLEMKSYDANQYFSKYLLFAKVESEVIHERVFSAFRDYLDSYCQLINLAIPLSRPYEIQRVINAQKKYDQYNAAHDPAHGLFSSHFGSDWATRFLYEFLFEEAKSVVTV